MEPKQPSQRCERCILPASFPGIYLNKNNLCNLCLEAPSAAQLQADRLKLKVELEATIAKTKNTAAYYDCIVAYSGGKDSSYTLKLLVQDYGLRCLAITIDNGFIAEQAVKNCKAVTAALSVDHIFFTPAPQFMRNLYVKSATQEDMHTRSAIKRASRMCNSCINLINTHMIKAAIQHQVQIIAGGYIGGQVPKDAAIMKIDLNVQNKLRTHSLTQYIKHLGPDVLKYLALETSTAKLTVLNPMLTVNLTEEQIIKSIEPLGWVKTKDTGLNSSNCQLNDLGIAVHYKQYGFHAYQFEISEQVRHGLLERDSALRKVETIPGITEINWQAEKLNLDFNKL